MVPGRSRSTKPFSVTPAVGRRQDCSRRCATSRTTGCCRADSTKPTAESEIAVYGGAIDDPDFADGSDRVRYQITLPEGQGAYGIEVELRFQAIGYRWAHNLQPYDAPEPKAFLEYFQAMSPSASFLIQRAVAEGRR